MCRAPPARTVLIAYIHIPLPSLPLFGERGLSQQHRAPARSEKTKSPFSGIAEGAWLNARFNENLRSQRQTSGGRELQIGFRPTARFHAQYLSEMVSCLRHRIAHLSTATKNVSIDLEGKFFAREESSSPSAFACLEQYGFRARSQRGSPHNRRFLSGLLLWKR